MITDIPQAGDDAPADRVDTGSATAAAKADDGGLGDLEWFFAPREVSREERALMATAYVDGTAYATLRRLPPYPPETCAWCREHPPAGLAAGSGEALCELCAGEALSTLGQADLRLETAQTPPGHDDGSPSVRPCVRCEAAPCWGGTALCAECAGALGDLPTEEQAQVRERIRAELARREAEATYCVCGRRSAGNPQAPELCAECVIYLVTKALPEAVARAKAAEILAAQGRHEFVFDTADDLVDAPDIEWIIEGLIPRQGSVLIFGEQYVGKSLATLALAGSIATGRPWLGQQITGGRRGAMVVCWGEGRAGLPQRFRAMVGGHLAGEIPPVLAPRDPFPLTEASAREFVQAVRSKAPEGVSVVLLDSKLDYLMGEENSNTDAQRLKRAMDVIAGELDCPVILVDHSGTSEDSKARNRGASRLAQAIDVRLWVKAGVIVAQKVKEGVAGASLGFRVVPVPGTASATVEPVNVLSVLSEAHREREHENEAVLLEFLESQGHPVTMPEIVAGTSIRAADRKGTLKQLVDDGRVEKIGRGVSGDPYRYVLAEE